MSERDEIQAVLGRAKPARGVSPRDFRQPRRMGQSRRRELGVALENQLPELERRLAELCGVRLELTLAGVGEAEADVAIATAGELPCVLRFRCREAPGWLVWEPLAAIDTLETILGARSAAPESRRLSPTEGRLATQLLAELVRGVAALVNVAPADFALVQDPAQLGTWREAGPAAESHRLEVALEVTLGERTSTLKLYLPGVECGSGETITSLPTRLPGHLERVEVELSARLEGCELTLDQLLALEAGDVIPLEARLGDPTTLTVEGLTLARGRLGSHRGRLAVRIERLSVEPEAAA